MSERKIIVVYLTEDGAIPVAIEATLAAMQQLVGGLIENVHVVGTLHLVVNEEGALERPKVLPVWWVINREPIHGPSFLTRSGPAEDGEEDYVGFDADEAASIAAALNLTARNTERPWTVGIGRPA